MNKKIFLVYFALIIIFTSTGCQLAREDAGDHINDDRLIGVFITMDYLDLFDMELYMKDNAKDLFGGGDNIVKGDSNRYQGRLYATLKTRTITDDRTGESFDIREYIFDGVDGISYFSATIRVNEKEDGYTTSGADKAISDAHTGLFYGDKEDRVSLEGTIYISPNHSDKTYYVNPVYQSADGSVYAISGSGYMTGGPQSEGSVFSKTIEETKTVTENGVDKKTSCSVKISFATMFPPEKIVILQMSGDSTVLSRTEYTPGKLPDLIVPDKAVEYILVETYKHDNDGNVKITRLLYDKGNTTLDTFFRREDSICVKQWTQLKW